MRTWIKICGTTSLDDALVSVEAGADALGFVFAPSARGVTPERAREICAQIPTEVERIGVFVDESADRIRATVEQAGLTAVQLHGGETASSVAALFPGSARVRRIGVIKALRVGSDLQERIAEFCNGTVQVDSILVDSGAGSGKSFDWQQTKLLLNGMSSRLIVAGGLNPENVGQAIRTFSPWGVDVVTGVESEPGKKDPEKIKAFVAAVRRTENA